MGSYVIQQPSTDILMFRITRESIRNAINYEVMEGLEHALNEVEENKRIKALVITGEGEQAFCSGGDLSVFHGLKTKEEALPMLQRMGNLLYRLATIPKPTVALVNGIAVGGGCELATACDFRLAREGTKMGFIQGTLAITTGWGGASLLYEKMDVYRAMKILMEADVYPVETLADWGYIHKIIAKPEFKEVESFLERMVLRDVNVIQSYKKVLVQKWVQNGLKERMDNEIKTCSELWEKDAHHEAVRQFLNK
jgi:enoyl-CoA hydratase